MIPTLANTKIGDVDRRDPVRLGPSASLVEAVTLLRERDRGAVVIEDETGLVGIFTEHDLVTRIDHGNHSWHKQTVGELMTHNPVTVAVGTPIAVVIKKMGRGGFRHVPLVGRDGKVVGVVSIRDILTHITEEFPQEFLNLPPGPDHAAKNQWGG